MGVVGSDEMGARMRHDRVGRAAISIVIAAATVSACGYAYDHRGDVAIARAIESAHAPGVESVDYNEGDSVDPPTIDVTMADDASRDQVLHVLCDVVVPARDAGSPSASVSIVIWRDGKIVESGDAACYSRSTPSASAMTLRPPRGRSLRG